jgi:hypothetical protein
MDADEIIDEGKFCRELRINPRTALRWRIRGWGPEYVRLGPRLIGYRRSAINEWLAQRSFKDRAAEIAI